MRTVMAAAVEKKSCSVPYTLTFCILLCSLTWFSRATARRCTYIKCVFILKLRTSGKFETKWLPSILDVGFELPYSATSNEETHAGLDRTDHTVSKVITVEVICFVAPEKLQKTLKFLELLSLFPRARLLANMNINCEKLFVI